MTGAVHLTTQRMELRRFTPDDVDLLVELDSDPAVMHFINGGRPSPRDEIETEVLPHFLGWYDRSAGYGFWAAVARGTGEFLGWFHLRPQSDAPPFHQPWPDPIPGDEQGDVEYALTREEWAATQAPR